MKLSELPKWKSLSKKERERLKEIYGNNVSSNDSLVSKKEILKGNKTD